MIKNWLLLSMRRFLRNLTGSLINIFGLTIGLTVFLLIFIYVRHEFSYDNFHMKSDQVYRLLKENPPGATTYNGLTKQAVLPAPLGDLLKTEITGLEKAARMANRGSVVVETDGKTFSEDSHHAADADLFSILTFKPIYGNADLALSSPNTVALSASTAIKYFGTTNAIGKVLEFTGFNQMGSFTVDFVFEDFPSNSSFQFNLILRFVDFVKAVQPTDLENWKNWNYNCMVRLSANTDPRNIEDDIEQAFFKKLEGTLDEEDKKMNFWLEPLSDIYLRSNVNFSNTPKNDENRLYMLATIAFFVLAVAGVNYVNLSTARSVKRAKEVGIRKVSGAFRGQLIGQFMLDAMLISFVSLILALLITGSIFPLYRDFIGKQLPFDLLSDPTLLAVVVFAPLGMGTIAGLYPAFVLASFKPVTVLKGNFSTSNEGNFMRDLLTVFQFTISGGLIIAVIIISQQLNFIENHNPGYDREHILRLPLTDEGVRSKQDFFVEELKKNPNILATSITSYFPNNVNTQQSRAWVGPNGTIPVSFYTIQADHNYLDLFNIKIAQGRNFSPDIPSDKNAFLINETAARLYGWDDPVGMQFTGETGGRAGDTVQIIGVIEDIHIANYRRPIEPFRIGMTASWSWILAIKIKPDNIKETLDHIEKNYKKLATTKFPFNISFFDEDFGKVYKTDQQLGRLINIFSVVAVLIACLGLYGLSIHTMAQRLKEIGIRKILGAEFFQITYMLSRKFVLLILVSFVIASPLAYYVMNQWLQSFAYHTTVGIGAFVITIVSMVIIALATVGSQTWKAATANPVNIIRCE